MGSRSLRLLNQSTHSRVPNSTASKLRQAHADQFGLVGTVDGLGESIVIGIPDAADRRFDTGFGQAFGVFD
jgi:hypothetical protein